MASTPIGRNLVFQIYNADGTEFTGLVMRKSTVESVVMSLGDKITGDVYYKDNSLAVTMHEYIEYNGVKYVLVNPPTVVREGMVSDNSELKGMTKYSFVFYHPMCQLGNFPFCDVAVSGNENMYLSENKIFSWIGKPDDYIAKLNKNLSGTQWIVVKSSRFPSDKDDELSDVIPFNNATVAEAIKTFYDTWEVPYIIDKVDSTESYYAQGKRFKVVFGLPSNEIYESDSDRQLNQPFVFKFGQGVGLKNNSRSPRNNKIVTRISGYGAERNIPYGYPQIPWYGDQRWEYTKYVNNDPQIDSEGVPHGTPTADAYPLYMGIVGGQYVKLIKHPFTRSYLMPSIYSQTVFNKVSPYVNGGGANPNYNPNITLVDYYDAIASQQYPYPNEINPQAPSYESHKFEDIYPELGSASITGAVPLDNNLQPASNWDDTMDDDGNYIQSYFQITLPQLTFDLYACAAITQEMEINMRSGACIGCTFPVEVDWDLYKANFYDEDGNFDPVIGAGHPRDPQKFPDSSAGSISVVVKKENTTFGTLMPNTYQHPVSGDEFVVLGISLPLSYITSAEQRLDESMKSYMLENNVYYFDYPLKFDEYWLVNHGYVLSQIRPNSIIRFEYAGTQLALYVKQLAVKYGENVLPQYDITLTDNVEVILNPIGRVADDVEKLSSLISILRENYNRSVWAEIAKKLSKVDDDTASGFIRFMKGLQVGSRFVSGLLGEGGIFRKNADGRTYLEVDEMYVRLKAYFDTVEIREYQHSHGGRVASSAGIKVSHVVPYGHSTVFDDDVPLDENGDYKYVDEHGDEQTEHIDAIKFYRCYYRAKDGDNTTHNSFQVGDLARCHMTDTARGIQTKDYWRAVVGTNASDGSETFYNDEYGWTDLSNELTVTVTKGANSKLVFGYMSGSSTPEQGDDLFQLGNLFEQGRRGAIMENTTGPNTPSYQVFQDLGLDTRTDQSTAFDPYTTTGKNYIDLGYDSGTGHAKLNVIGDAFIGAADNSSYISYSQADKKVRIKAILDLASTFGDGGSTIQSYLTWNQTQINTLLGDINAIQQQIDGSIETWFYDYMPINPDGATLADRQEPLIWLDENHTIPCHPYYDWYITDTTAGNNNERLKHLGDIFYDNKTGRAFRFSNTGTEANPHFAWVEIEDSAVIKALEDAARAQDTADNKRRVFVTQPPVIAHDDGNYVEYDVGDLWVNAQYPSGLGTIYNNDLLRCCRAKPIRNSSGVVTDGTFDINDWQLASKYTDDSALLEFLDGYQGQLTDVLNQIDKKAETWYQNSDPSASARPNGWLGEDDAEHYGDLWYCTDDVIDQTTQQVIYGKGTTWFFDVRDNGEGANPRYTYYWHKQNIPDSVFDMIDGKSTIYVAWGAWGNDSNLAVGDLYIPAADETQSGTTYKAGHVYRWKAVAANTYAWVEVAYTDDTAFNEYITQVVGGATASDPTTAAAAAAIRAVTGALVRDTNIVGGLILTSMVALRGGSNDEVWAGISGLYDDDDYAQGGAKGHGIAAWYGGNNGDREAMQEETPSYPIPDSEWDLRRWAKTLFRFDGSGYLANGNITWDSQGRVAIKDITTLVGGNDTDILNSLTTFNSAFHFTTAQGSSTILNINPQYAFSHLEIYDENGNHAVATHDELAGYLPLSAGSGKKLTGALYAQSIYTKTTSKYNLGHPLVYWKNLYVNRIYLGADVYLEYDSENTAVKLNGSFYATGGIAALGAGSGGSGGGGVGDVTWDALANPATGTPQHTIHYSYISGILNDYVTFSQMQAQGYITSAALSSYVTQIKVGTTDYNPSSGVVSLPAYPTVPTNVSAFTNDSGYITSSASITGNAATATQLQTARTIWGRPFDGTGDVSGAISDATTISASSDVSVGGKLSVNGIATIQNCIDIDRTNHGSLPLGTQINILRAKSKNAETGTYGYNTVIATFGSGETNRTANFPVRIGSTSGATVISAGESGKTFPSQNTGICNTENLYLEADGSIAMYAGVNNESTNYASQLAIFIDTSCNVGIGTSSPSHKLDVSGNIYASGNVASGNMLSCSANLSVGTSAIIGTTLSVGSWISASGTIYGSLGAQITGEISATSHITSGGNVTCKNVYTSNAGTIGGFSNIELGYTSSHGGGSIYFHYSGITGRSSAYIRNEADEQLSVLSPTGHIGLKVGGANGDYIQIGEIRIGYDSANNALEIYKLENNVHAAANIYARGGVSALGYGSGGSGGGGVGDVTWDALAGQASGGHTIHHSYIDDVLLSYATESYVQSYVHLNAPHELSDLGDVVVSGVGHGDILTYNAVVASPATPHWKNTSKSEFLSGYATETWVGNNYYISNGTIYMNGQSITPSSIVGNYLPLSAGASYPLTGDLYISPYERIAITSGTAPTGHDFSALTGAISFCIFTARTDNDTSAFILNGDTAIIYNAFDTGWGFQVHDEDLANGQSNVFNDNTRAFGVTQDYNAWVRGGFVKNGSNNDYVLLGGGGHAAISGLSVSHANTSYVMMASAYLNTTALLDAFHQDGTLKCAYITNDVAQTFGATDGILLAIGVGDYYGHQVLLDDSHYQIFHRVLIDGNWQSWATIIDSSTIGNQSVNYATSAGSLAYKPAVESSDALDTAHWANQLNAYMFTGFNTSILNGNGLIIDGGCGNTSYGFQILIDDDPTYVMGLRQRNDGGWNAWKRIPMGDGTGASGTWDISISGNAATATSATTATTASTLYTNDSSQDANNCYDGTAGLHFYRTNGGNIGNDGFILQWSWNVGYVGQQLYLDDNPSGIMMIRGFDIGTQTFGSWYRIYTDAYHPDASDADTLDGYHEGSFQRAVTTTQRDFPDGTLITTNIDYSVTSGDPFYVEIKGNAYQRGYSCFTQVQGYIYDNEIISYGVSHLGIVQITGIIAINVDGYLCFWFPRQGYWEGYSIAVYSALDYRVNRVTSITNSTEPSGTKRVNLSANTHYTITSANISSQAVSNSDMVDGEHAYQFAHRGTANNLLVAGNEFNFISAGFSGVVWFNYQDENRGSDSNVTGYYFGNGRSGWNPILHAGGYSTPTNSSAYALTSDGGVAHIGSMSVNYANGAGNADTVDGLHVHDGRNNEANKIVRTDSSGYIQCGYINSSDGDEANNSSPARVWGTNGSDSYLRTYLTSALSVNYAAYAGQLYTARSLWGNSFNGTADVTGGLTVLGQANQFGRGTGASEINYNTYSVYIGTESTRTATAGLYTSGIAFTSMMKYNGGDGYLNSPQGWIGLRLYDFPGSERACLVFATKEGTNTSNTGTDIPTERMCIDPFGNVGIGTTSPSQKLDVAGQINASSHITSGGNVTCKNVYSSNAGTISGFSNIELGYTSSHCGGSIYFHYSGITGRSSAYIRNEADEQLSVLSPTGHIGLKVGGANGDYIQIGDIRIGYDSANNALKVVGSDGSSAANFYATGAVSALGANTSGGGGTGVSFKSTGNITLARTGNTDNRSFVIATLAGTNNYGTSSFRIYSVAGNTALQIKVFVSLRGSEADVIVEGDSEDVIDNVSIVQADGNTRIQVRPGTHGNGVVIKADTYEGYSDLENSLYGWTMATGTTAVTGGTHIGIAYMDDGNGFFCSKGIYSEGKITCGSLYSFGSIYIEGNITNDGDINAGGDVHANAFINDSDARLKDIQDYEATIDLYTLAYAPAIHFKWNNKPDTRTHVGTIAQYWQGVMPEVISESKDGYLSMQYDVLALLAAISVAKKVVDHERRIMELEEENAYLKYEINQLKKVA